MTMKRISEKSRMLLYISSLAVLGLWALTTTVILLPISFAQDGHKQPRDYENQTPKRKLCLNFRKWRILIYSMDIPESDA